MTALIKSIKNAPTKLTMSQARALGNNDRINQVNQERAD